MKKIIFIFTILLLLVVVYCGYNFKKNKDEEKFIIQKFGVLNTINPDEVETMPIEKIKEISNLGGLPLIDYINHDYDREIKVKSLLPNYYKYKNEWGKKADLRLNEEKIMNRKKAMKVRYEKFLRKIQGISDETIIKQRLEILEKTNKVAIEDDDKNLWDKYYSLYED